MSRLIIAVLTGFCFCMLFWLPSVVAVWMLLLASVLASVFAVVVVFHKPLLSLWTRLRSLVSRKPSDKQQKKRDLYRSMSLLRQDLAAWSLDWQNVRRKAFADQHQQEPASLPPEPHQAYWSEFEALSKSLSHLGSPAYDERLTLKDLEFYHGRFADLAQRFHVFEQQYAQRRRLVARALSEALVFHSQVARFSHQPGINQPRKFWGNYGAYRTLEELLQQGCQPEAILPKMQSLQQEMEQLLERHPSEHRSNVPPYLFQ